jgi:hypothetical protein
MDDTLGAPPQNLLGLTLAFPTEAAVSPQKRALVCETYGDIADGSVTSDLHQPSLAVLVIAHNSTRR